MVSLLFGLVLLGTALVRYVTARDMQRQEPTAPPADVAVVVGLLVAGASLAAGGAAELTRWSRPVVVMLAATILLGAAGVTYLHASDVRRHEQAVLDRRWEEEAGRAARRFPPALPGGRPGHVALRGLTVVLGLLAGGVVLCGVGLAMLLNQPATSRHTGEDPSD